MLITKTIFRNHRTTIEITERRLKKYPCTMTLLRLEKITSKILVQYHKSSQNESIKIPIPLEFTHALPRFTPTVDIDPRMYGEARPARYVKERVKRVKRETDRLTNRQNNNKTRPNTRHKLLLVG